MIQRLKHSFDDLQDIDPINPSKIYQSDRLIGVIKEKGQIEIFNKCNFKDPIFIEVQMPDMSNQSIEQIYQFEKANPNKIAFFKRAGSQNRYKFEYNSHLGDVIVKTVGGKEVSLSLYDYLDKTWEVYFYDTLN